MGKWYRALVAFMAVSAVVCTTALIYAGCTLWKIGSAQVARCENFAVHWSLGSYEATGYLDDGLLKEMTIRRIDQNNLK